MGALHQQVVAAHMGAALCCRSAVDGHILAYLVVVANLCRRVLARKLEVLRDGTDYSSGEEDVAIADACAVEHSDTVHKHVVVADDHPFVDIAESADFAVLADDGLGMHIGQWTDFAHKYIFCLVNGFIICSSLSGP